MCLTPNSNEVWRHSAEAHHDLPELRSGTVQTHEVSSASQQKMHFMCGECQKVVPLVKPASLLPCHGGSSVSNPPSLRKSNLFRIVLKLECYFSIKHQLCSFLPWLTSFSRIPPPTHSPHNINLISSFSSLAISNCFHFSTTLIFDWRPTSFCCVRAKCWRGISPHRAFRWHITFFSGHAGGAPQPSGDTGCAMNYHRFIWSGFLCFDNVTLSRRLNVTVLSSAWDLHSC